jgi:hypothetical protein
MIDYSLPYFSIGMPIKDRSGSESEFEKEIYFG